MGKPYKITSAPTPAPRGNPPPATVPAGVGLVRAEKSGLPLNTPSTDPMNSPDLIPTPPAVPEPKPFKI